MRILIADDTDTDRLILSKIVELEGHQVLEAKNGQEAVDNFVEYKPDIVLLDVMMPVMDGLVAAQQIRQLAGEDLVPIIFLTSLSDTDSLVKCLGAGGDDFMSKPYSRVILQAKIKALGRMRQMHLTLHAQRDEIAGHNDHLLREQEVAKQLFDKIAHSGCLDASNIRYMLSPLSIFNGDVLVAAYTPSGNMMMLVGDFTGHGLPAAVGAIPLASIFYDKVQRGFSVQSILSDINERLCEILPTGFFCCATMIEVDYQGKRIKYWNGGLPPGYLHREGDGRIAEFESKNLPLGIVPARDFNDAVRHINVNEGDRMFLWTDGIIEAENLAGEMYGESRLNEIFLRYRDGSEIYDAMVSDVDQFVGDEREAVKDDITVVEVLIADSQSISQDGYDHEHESEEGLRDWSMEFEVRQNSFLSFDPRPMLMQVIMEVPGLRGHMNVLYTILSELYSNALEHGVLQLDSSLKHSAQGFQVYYNERERRARESSNGFVRVGFDHKLIENGGILIIEVSDSGDGFDYKAIADRKNSQTEYSGRGLGLLLNLCHSLKFNDDGNAVEAVYTWKNKRSPDTARTAE